MSKLQQILMQEAKSAGYVGQFLNSVVNIEEINTIADLQNVFKKRLTNFINKFVPTKNEDILNEAFDKNLFSKTLKDIQSPYSINDTIYDLLQRLIFDVYYDQAKEQFNNFIVKLKKEIEKEVHDEK